MAISRDMIGIKGDECQCGRRWTIRHCIACGSTRLYTRQNRHHTMLDGTVKLVEKETRCQSCGQLFIEEERQWCEAPPVGQTLAKLRVQRLAEAVQSGEYLRPQDAKAAEVIEKLIGKSQQKSVEVLEQGVDPEVIKLADESSVDSKVVKPIDLDKEDFSIADRALRLEWAHMKLAGQAPTATADEYVERRLKGELFQ
jgi:hypothetical protein